MALQEVQLKVSGGGTVSSVRSSTHQLTATALCVAACLGSTQVELLWHPQLLPELAIYCTIIPWRAMTRVMLLLLPMVNKTLVQALMAGIISNTNTHIQLGLIHWRKHWHWTCLLCIFVSSSIVYSSKCNNTIDYNNFIIITALIVYIWQFFKLLVFIYCLKAELSLKLFIAVKFANNYIS